jgi:hypothetical protein
MERKSVKRKAALVSTIILFKPILFITIYL